MHIHNIVSDQASRPDIRAIQNALPNTNSMIPHYNASVKYTYIGK